MLEDPAITCPKVRPSEPNLHWVILFEFFWVKRPYRTLEASHASFSSRRSLLGWRSPLSSWESNTLKSAHKNQWAFQSSSPSNAKKFPFILHHWLPRYWLKPNMCPLPIKIEQNPHQSLRKVCAQICDSSNKQEATKIATSSLIICRNKRGHIWPNKVQSTIHQKFYLLQTKFWMRSRGSNYLHSIHHWESCQCVALRT